MRKRPPEPWLRLMEAKGLGSYRRLADRAGMAHETARGVVLGLGSDRRSIQKVADALGVDIELIHELRGEAERDTPWEPPAVARHLTPDERDALGRLITLMTTGREDGGGDDRQAAPIGGVNDVTVEVSRQAAPPPAGASTKRSTPGRPGRGSV